MFLDFILINTLSYKKEPIIIKMQAINFFVRRHLNKQLGKSVILQCQYEYIINKEINNILRNKHKHYFNKKKELE